jgi:squalene cyclase
MLKKHSFCGHDDEHLKKVIYSLPELRHWNRLTNMILEFWKKKKNLACLR